MGVTAKERKQLLNRGSGARQLLTQETSGPSRTRCSAKGSASQRWASRGLNALWKEQAHLKKRPHIYAFRRNASPRGSGRRGGALYVPPGNVSKTAAVMSTP